ncbi:hypothetical protein [Pukyongiella litopenaei]|uniref:Glycine zipper family protein n=1 Tax=Pukyongiella litopenaei TaxID=2605946 RepID=A0A5C2H9F2_9RHOB|nr:hypothetical protein [Pukyongiella litopenaei]QEP30419.1 hypothetical protein C6Y53_19575 [Pukyongiella litopenaei]
MNSIKTTAAALGACLILSACFGGGSQTTTNVTAMNGLSSVASASARQPTKADLGQSCAALDAELTTLYAQAGEIDRAERARSRRAGLTLGLLDAGLSVAGAGALTKAGSVQAIRNVGTATALAGSATAATGGASVDPQAYNRMLAISERAAVLERAKVAKGC